MDDKIKTAMFCEGSWQQADRLYARPTGTWREKKPVIDEIKCCHCGWCSIYCPVGCIDENSDSFAPDLRYCKGCGICAKECPVTAIQMVPEE